MPSHLPRKRPFGAQAESLSVALPRICEEVKRTFSKATAKSILGDITNRQSNGSEKHTHKGVGVGKPLPKLPSTEYTSEEIIRTNHADTDQIQNHNSQEPILTETMDTAPIVGEKEAEEEILSTRPPVEFDELVDIAMETDSTETDSGIVVDESDPFNPTTQEIEEADKHDVNMVAEYADEIMEYMKELEVRMMPDHYYIDRQPELKWHMRGILLDWLVQVHDRFKMHQETLFLCANYIDRFLSVKEISVDKLQLVGITALFIAAKYEEISAPTISEMVFMVDKAYSVDDLKKAERFMINILNYELGYPGPLSFLRRVSKADRYDSSIRTLAKYLVEVTIMYEVFLQYPSSKIAAASYYLSMGLLNKGTWTNSHIHYSGYTEMDLMQCALQIRSRLPHKQNHEAIYIKYYSAKYLRASEYVDDVFKNYI